MPTILNIETSHSSLSLSPDQLDILSALRDELVDAIQNNPAQLGAGAEIYQTLFEFITHDTLTGRHA